MLLRELGLDLIVDPADVPEVRQAGECPRRFAKRVAWEKASTVARRHPGEMIVAADTVVLVDDLMLGKPQDTADACRMLRTLSGRSHQVMTAVAMILPDTRRDEFVSVTGVTFRALQEEEIVAYVGTGEPFDKAGAYAIQGGARPFVIAIDGSHSNVIGLPVEALSERFAHYGMAERRLS